MSARIDAMMASIEGDEPSDEGVPEAIDPKSEVSQVEELSMDDVAIEAESAPITTAAPPMPRVAPPRPALPPLPPARPPLPPLSKPPLPPLARPPGAPPSGPASAKGGIAVIPPRLVSVPPITAPSAVPPMAIPSAVPSIAPAAKPEPEGSGNDLPRVEVDVPDVGPADHGAPKLSPADLAARHDLHPPTGVGQVSDPGIPIDISELEPVPAPEDTSDRPVPETDKPLEHHLETPTAVERAVAALGDAAWEARANELTRQLDVVGERERLAEIAYELGELCERRLADEARAVKAFGRALSSDPSLRANLWAIRRVFYRRGLWPNLIKLIDAESRFARDDAERADLACEKATVLSEKLGNLDGARTALEEAANLDPTALTPLYALERIALADNDRARLIDLWAQLATASARPERKLVYLLEQVRFWSDEGGGDLDRARMLLAEAAALGIDAERVAAERLRVAELANDRDELLVALEQQAGMVLARTGPAGAPDAATSPASPGAAPSRGAMLRLQVVALRRRQAQVARAGGDGDRAWNYLQAALALAPGEALLLADLADLAEELGRYDELADLVQSWQSIEGDPRRALTLSIRRADALLRGGQREPALALLASLEATAPGLAPVAALRERDALTALDFAALGEAWTRAGDALRTGADVGTGTPVVDPPAAVASYVAAATVWSHDVGEERGDAEALTALGKALEIAPRDPVALEALVDLHERAGRVEDATRVLEDAITAAQPQHPAEAIRLLNRLGRLLRSHGRLEEAIAVDARRFVADPSDRVTGWRIDSTLDELGRDEERLANLRVLAGLDDNNADTGQGEHDPARRGLALVTAARIAEVLGQGDTAIELYRKTLVLWPDDGFSRVALRAALRRSGRSEELAAARLAEADSLADGPAVIEALTEAAWVLEDHVGDTAAAHAAYRRLVDRVQPGESIMAHARAGLARTAPTPSEAARALAQLAEDAVGDLAAPAAVAVGQALEHAGEKDAAVDSYREAVAAGGPGTVGSAFASIALADLAQKKNDTALRVEAERAFAARISHPATAAAIHEDLGWLHALVLEDFDQAARSFAEATTADPDSAGALLGAALVAARRQDQGVLSDAYARLAARLTMPEAAAALHLRAAAMATASGEPDLAMARVAAARIVDPDDVGALLVSAEHSAVATAPQPGEDPAAAIDRLLARADILAMRSTLAEDPAARDGWELDRAEALEAAGRLKEAGAAVAGVLRGAPSDLRALTALHRLAKRGGDRPAQARAAVALAQRSADPETKRLLWSDAVAIVDPGGYGAPPNRSAGADMNAAVAIYRQMVTDDPGSVAFERLRQLLRGGGDVRGLVLALGARLAWADGTGDLDAGVPLLMERAEIRRALGDRHAARADLDNLLDRAPDHAQALRTQAEIALELGDAQRAVELWRRYIPAETDATRRADADILLSKLLAEDMGDVNGAILQLERVIAQNPRDIALRDRMVGLATRANDWTRAARELRELVRLRQSPGERARDELRLGQMLRDRMGDRREAHAAFERGRQLDPLNLDLLHELAELVGGERPGARADVIGKGIDDLRSALSTSPGTTVVYERLAAAFGWLGDRDGQWLALGVIEALATPTPEQKQLLVAGRSRDLPPIAKLPLDNNARAALRAPGSEGVLSEIWRSAGPSIAATVGVDPARLGFARGDKMAVKALGKKYEALAAGLASLGLEAELYVSDGRAGAAWAIAGETPMLCLGGDVASGATPMARYLLGRALWLAADGAGTLADLKEQEVVWFLIAALRAAELQVPPALTEFAAGEEAAVAERVKMVAKHMARRDRKVIASLAPRLGHFGEPLGWRRAKLASAQRMGLLYAGDLAVALGAMDVGRGGRHIATDPAALELASWSVSAAHLELRRTRQMALSAGGVR